MDSRSADVSPFRCYWLLPNLPKGAICVRFPTHDDLMVGKIKSELKVVNDWMSCYIVMTVIVMMPNGKMWMHQHTAFTRERGEWFAKWCEYIMCVAWRSVWLCLREAKCVWCVGAEWFFGAKYIVNGVLPLYVSDCFVWYAFCRLCWGSIAESEY